MPAVEYKDSAQVSNLTNTEEDEIMNTFMEGESYLGFANAAPHAIYGSNEKSPAVLEGDMLYFFCILVLRTGILG